MTKAQSDYAHSYEAGDVIVSAYGKKSQGVSKATPYIVTSVPGADNKLFVKAENGTAFQIDPSKISHKTVYKTTEIEIAEGDQLRWTKNDNKQGRRNGQTFQVRSINNDGTLDIDYGSGHSERVDRTKAQFTDYSFVMTSYASQGKTKDRVLILADQTHGRESLYVALSRAKYHVKVFTESFDKLVKNAHGNQIKRSVEDLFKGPQRKAERNTVKSETLKETVSYLRKGAFSLAYSSLSSSIVDAGSEKKRHQAVVEAFLAKTPLERKDTLIIASNEKDRVLLTNQIRERLASDKWLTDRRDVQMLAPKLKNAPLQKGDYLAPLKGSSNLGLKKGVPYYVEDIKPDKVTVSTTRGVKKEIPVNTVGYKVFQTEKSDVAVGDRLIVTDHDGAKTLGNLVSITKSTATIECDNGKIHKIQTDKPMNVQHGIVQSPFSRVGGDRKNVVMSCDSKIGSKALLQSVDRANERVTLHTDSKKTLQARMVYYESKAVDKKLDEFQGKVRDRSISKGKGKGLGI